MTYPLLFVKGVTNKDTFKSTYDIMDELSTKWQDLTDIQQASITELIAGKRLPEHTAMCDRTHLIAGKV